MLFVIFERFHGSIRICHNVHATLKALQDEEAELLAELARIRKEREQEAAKKAAEAEKSRQQALQEEVIHGNPLYRQAQADFQVCYSYSCGFAEESHPLPVQLCLCLPVGMQLLHESLWC